VTSATPETGTLDLSGFREALRAIHPGTTVRPGQETCLLTLDRFLSTSVRRLQPGQESPLLASCEVATGTGKTEAILAAAALAWKRDGRRTIIATWTRALRDRLAGHGSDFLEAFAARSGWSRRPAIASLRPIGSICSLITAREAVEASETPEAQAWLSWIEDAYSRGVPPTLDDWASDGGTLEFLSEDRAIAQKRAGMRPSEIGKLQNLDDPASLAACEVLSALQAENDFARNGADILVVTHSLFIRNGIEFGIPLSTNAIEINDQPADRRRCAAIIDEADCLATSGLPFTASFSTSAVDAALGRRSTIRLRQLCKDVLAGRKTASIDSDEEKAGLAQTLNHGKTPIASQIARLHAGGDRSLESLLSAINTILSWHEESGNARGASANDAGLTAVIRPDPDDPKESYLISMECQTPERLISRTWVNRNLHTIDHIGFISGTLLDTSGTLRSFQKTTGIRTDKDRLFGTNPSKPDLLVSLANPPLASLTLVSGGEEPFKGGELNPAFWQGIADRISRLSDPEEPTLVLLPSYASQDMLRAIIKVSSDIIWQGPGGAAHATRELASRAASGLTTTVVALTWQGVNYVDAAGRTLIKRIIIPQIPRPPISRDRDYDGFKALTAASWRMRQGIGRMLRSPADCGHLEVLDPGFDATEITRRIQLQTKRSASFRDLAFSVLGKPRSPGCLFSRTETDVIIEMSS